MINISVTSGMKLKGKRNSLSDYSYLPNIKRKILKWKAKDAPQCNSMANLV